ncbi:Peptidase M15 [compost metagenome]
MGIDNSPNAEHLEAMKFTAGKMEIVREVLDNRPIYVTSWYRSVRLNAVTPGSSSTSQHSKGQAVDFICIGFGSPERICLELRKHKDIIQYDQLILEPGWVHISFVPVNPRMKELTYEAKNKYLPGLVV